MKLALSALSFAVVAVSAKAFSQQPKRYDVQVHAGAVAQDGQFSVRTSFGATASIEVLRRLPHDFSAGPSLSVAGFSAPEQFISPGGCLRASPCNLPSPSAVRIATLGAVGVYTPPSGDDDVAPFLLAGVGMRYLTESPERDSDTRPYAEVGLGTTIFRRFVVRVRYQATQSGSELPSWAMPMTVGIAF